MMEIPVIIKVLASLGVIIFISKWIRHLHIPVLAGALFLGISCGHSFRNIFFIACERSISENSLFMLAVVVMIIWLSSQMSEAGIMKELVMRVRRRVSQKTAIALLPALIGLLPMPGGALFSAPLVDDCDHSKTLDAMLKTKINYWFRHIWEYWWPLYPGVLLALEITGVDIVTFMLTTLPLSIFSVTAGWYFLLRHVKNNDDGDNQFKNNNDSSSENIFPLLMPIIIIITVYALIRISVPAVAAYNKYTPMLLGIAGAIVYLQIYHPLSAAVWKKIILAKRVWLLALLVLLVRVYGAFMEADLPDGTSLVDTLRCEFVNLNISPLVVIAVIPFICGMTTGLALGFVGASFPIVMSMAGPNPEPAVLLPIIALAYGCGYMGMLLSPVHVCLIVTNQHFKTRLYASIKNLLPVALVMIVLIFAYYFILKTVLTNIF